MDILILLAVVVVLTIAAVALGIGILVKDWRARRNDLLRAGSPEGEDDPRKAFNRSQGKAAWTRISGGGF